MPDRDAFGNEIRPGATGAPFGGSDADAAFGAEEEPAASPQRPAPPPARPAAARPRPAPTVGAGGAPRQQHAPAASVDDLRAPTEQAGPAPVTSRTTTGSGLAVVPRVAGGCISFVAILLVVGGCALTGLVGTVRDGVDTFRSVSTEFSTPPRAVIPPPAKEPRAKRPATPPRGLERRSLLRAAEFSRALTRLRRAGLGRPRVLRVAPDRIDTQLVTRTGRLRSVQILPGGALSTISTTPSGGFVGDLISLASVDRSAPQRLARAAAGRAGLPLSRVDYLVLSAAGGSARWTVFLRNGPAYSADRTGRIERAIR